MKAMVLAASLACCLGVSACEQPGRSTVAETPPTPQPDTCGMTRYAALVGKPITDPGVPPPGRGVRHIGPNTQVTMDFSESRLNIEHDARGVITRLRCG